jgi:hypothetical protein
LAALLTMRVQDLILRRREVSKDEATELKTPAAARPEFFHVRLFFVLTRFLHANRYPSRI